MLEDVIVDEVVEPAVGVEHGVVELLVGEAKPRGALVIQVGERAFLEFGFAGTFGVEPAVALLDEVLRCSCDRLHTRIGARLFARRPG